MTLHNNKNNKRRPPGLLSHGRPPTFKKKAPSLSSKATRTLIRTHHQLVKQKSTALSKGDTHLAQSITSQIEAQGGLKEYQQASLQGQSSQRGGDTSRILMDWLQPIIIQESSSTSTSKSNITTSSKTRMLKMLEIGSLTPHNACSQSGLFQMTRIDLHPQDGTTIQKQDFMLRPLPPPPPVNEDDDYGKFDIVSLSLVLNYVSDPSKRGEMLFRTTQFLRPLSPDMVGSAEYFPSLFLVLPAPCVDNSRYLDENRLEDMMSSIGYECVRRKRTTKLAYWLWRFDESRVRRDCDFTKKSGSAGCRKE